MLEVLSPQYIYSIYIYIYTFIGVYVTLEAPDSTPLAKTKVSSLISRPLFWGSLTRISLSCKAPICKRWLIKCSIPKSRALAERFLFTFPLRTFHSRPAHYALSAFVPKRFASIRLTKQKQRPPRNRASCGYAASHGFISLQNSLVSGWLSGWNRWLAGWLAGEAEKGQLARGLPISVAKS